MRKPRVRFELKPAEVTALREEEIVAILRAADDMVGRGGRTLLTSVLRGSREKSVLAHGLEANPSYGYYRDLSKDEAGSRVDWMITHDYLAIEYAGRLPVIVFTPTGWEIEKETMAQEFLRELDALAVAGPPFDMSHLKDRDRGMIHLLLDKVEASGRRELIPLLEAWAAIDYQKVRSRIHSVIRSLDASPA